MTSIA